jgi:hypothetical protein
MTDRNRSHSEMWAGELRCWPRAGWLPNDPSPLVALVHWGVSWGIEVLIEGF